MLLSSFPSFPFLVFFFFFLELATVSVANEQNKTKWKQNKVKQHFPNLVQEPCTYTLCFDATALQPSLSSEALLQPWSLIETVKNVVLIHVIRYMPLPLHIQWPQVTTSDLGRWPMRVPFNGGTTQGNVHNLKMCHSHTSFVFFPGSTNTQRLHTDLPHKVSSSFPDFNWAPWPVDFGRKVYSKVQDWKLRFVWRRLARSEFYNVNI